MRPKGYVRAAFHASPSIGGHLTNSRVIGDVLVDTNHHGGTL